MKPASMYEYIINDNERMIMHQQLESIQAPEKISYTLTNDVLVSKYSYQLDAIMKSPPYAATITWKAKMFS